MRKFKSLTVVNLFAIVLAASLLFGGTKAMAEELVEEPAEEQTEENTEENTEDITEAAYKIEHYVSDTKEGPFALEETEEYTEIPGTEIEANPMIFEDYVFDASIAGNITSGIVAEDGSLVLKFYYVKERFPLLIHYVYEDGSKAAEDYLGMYLPEEAFLVKSPVIDGFTVTYSEIKSGAFGMQKGGLEFTVTYVEEKKEEEPVDPDDPGESENPETPVYEEAPQPAEETPAPVKKQKKPVAVRTDSVEDNEEKSEEAEEETEELEKEEEDLKNPEESDKKEEEEVEEKQEELKEIEDEDPPLTQPEIEHNGIGAKYPYLFVILVLVGFFLYKRLKRKM